MAAIDQEVFTAGVSYKIAPIELEINCLSGLSRNVHKLLDENSAECDQKSIMLGKSYKEGIHEFQLNLASSLSWNGQKRLDQPEARKQ